MTWTKNGSSLSCWADKNPAPQIPDLILLFPTNFPFTCSVLALPILPSFFSKCGFCGLCVHCPPSQEGSFFIFCISKTYSSITFCDHPSLSPHHYHSELTASLPSFPQEVVCTMNIRLCLCFLHQTVYSWRFISMPYLHLIPRALHSNWHTVRYSYYFISWVNDQISSLVVQTVK